MTNPITRRTFLTTSAAAGASGWLAAAPSDGAESPQDRPGVSGPAVGRGAGLPVAISSGNGLRAVEEAMARMQRGEDTLEAAVSGVNIVEEDPDDITVGYGGLPNEDGVVELDSCVMHGPTQNAGSVAAIQGIKTPSRIAKLVMERTDHVMIVGEGAQRFARAHGYKPVDLLTDKTRRLWLKWKESLSDRDDWLTPKEAEATYSAPRETGTITCLALSGKREVSGVTTTSGLAFKIPGRVGDSPIIGAGLYVDGEVGACGATGRGEAVIISGGSRIVVENLRHGLDPKSAIYDVLERIARQTLDPRLRKKDGRPDFQVVLYAVDRQGRYAAGSLWGGRSFAVHDGKSARIEKAFSLYEKA